MKPTGLDTEKGFPDLVVPDTLPPTAELPGPSTKPALVVFGIALILFLAIGLDLWLAGGDQSSPTTQTPVTIPGAGLPIESASGPLKPITSSGNPPPDIIAALDLPQGSTEIPGSTLNQGIETYDQSIGFRISVSQSDVLTFFDTVLKANGWKILSKSPAAHSSGIQLIATHPSGDGYYWELGVLVSPTQFPSSSSSTESTPYTMRIYEVTDDDT